MKHAFSFSGFFRLLLIVGFTLQLSTTAEATSRERIEAFLETTGFDVALDGIAFASTSAPQMLGMVPDDFGTDWARAAKQVFDVQIMHRLAVEILEQTLTETALEHAITFYSSELGQRLVEVENASHKIEDDTYKQEQGRAIVADLVKNGAPRVEILNRMNRAIDSSDSALRALQEIQIRFLLAAHSAGVIELDLDGDDLRQAIKQNESATRTALRMSALAGAAYTYQVFPDEDIQTYAEELEYPLMQEVYELLNAVQYEIMANRFEALAQKMKNLETGQDI
ncbi:DUF2059 domain-containing protein [Ruegeria litorea]|uniref:DUF2059 domain-containing protein n=1 Tax=Falsiruegeria litorea TaxID=1280831 RepID=A0ABS5WMF7_9RHOB|nr:DUF2059 domain-containing protein [Falsiruegeria litorea]MBT3140316.1 DUF2059 domain-containing protein [Falsiruegeria litorea]